VPTEAVRVTGRDTPTVLAERLRVTAGVVLATTAAVTLRGAAVEALPLYLLSPE
jgi:hypothetical protein